MTTDDIAARHHNRTSPDKWCSWCGWFDGPACDTRQVLDQLDAAQEALRLADAALLRVTTDGHSVTASDLVGDEVMDAVFARELVRDRERQR